MKMKSTIRVMVNEIKKRKRELRVAAMRHERAFAKSYTEISDNFTSGRAKVLLVGGGLVVAYWATRFLILRKGKSPEIRDDIQSKDVKMTRQTDNEILNLIKEKIALFLVDLAQDLIREAIKKIDK